MSHSTCNGEVGRGGVDGGGATEGPDGGGAVGLYGNGAADGPPVLGFGGDPRWLAPAGACAVGVPIVLLSGESGDTSLRVNFARFRQSAVVCLCV